MTPRARLLLPSLLLALSIPVSAPAPRAPHGTGGAVVSGDPRATAVGIDVLEDGGNAVDAAVATALALAVVFPEAGNLGGGGFAVVRMPASVTHGPAAHGFEVGTLDFREEAPAAATRDMYLDPEGRPVPGASLVGGLAVGVPGSPTGLYELHRRYGHLPWARVVAPAERLARDGVEVDAHLRGRVEEARDVLARFPEAASVWLPDGRPPAVGARLRFPDLAETLHAYAERGPEAITHGALAERVAEVVRRHGGILTAADLADYRPVWRAPVAFDAFGWHFAGMDLPSSGTVILGEVFGVLERLAWRDLPRFGADRTHLLTEAFRGAYADRFRLGEPGATGVPVADLLKPDWLDRRAAEIRRDRATPSTEMAPYPAAPPHESTDTTHLSVVDGAGGAVALTTTLNALFGSKVWVPGLGFLNDEMDDFTTAPGEPNLFGLVQGEENEVRPGARMLSSMCPTIGWRQTDPAAGPKAPVLVAIGGRGGSRIPTNTAQALLAAIVDGDHCQLALDRPRIHHQWFPDRLEVEPDALAPETRNDLAARGHEILVTTDTARVNAICALADGTQEAAYDPRGTGTGAVVTPAGPKPE